MKNVYSTLIFIDSIVNLIIGFVLLLFPWGVPTWLGLPVSDNHFYPLILGAVIFGIGIALLIEFAGRQKEWRGLGLQGAISINFFGGGILLIWLLFYHTNTPLRGIIILWIVAIVVLAIGLVEITTTFFKRSNPTKF